VWWSSRRGSSRQFSLSRQQLHFNSPPFIVSPAFSPGYHIDIDGQTRQLCGGKRQTAAGDSWKLSPSRQPIDAICDLTNKQDLSSFPFIHHFGGTIISADCQ